MIEQVEEQVENTEGLWTRCTASLREQVSDATWQMWLSNVAPIGLDHGEMTLGVPNGVVRERVESRFLPLIEETLATVAGEPIHVHLLVADRPTGYLSDAERLPARPEPPVPGSPSEGRPEGGRSVRVVPLGTPLPVSLDPRFTFDTFVAAPSNRLAHAAAQSVAEIPGRSYNPLFIYGASGLGKTHLLHAIGNYVGEHFHSHRVLYVTTETFLNDFVDVAAHVGHHRLQAPVPGV